VDPPIAAASCIRGSCRFLPISAARWMDRRIDSRGADRRGARRTTARRVWLSNALDDSASHAVTTVQTSRDLRAAACSAIRPMPACCENRTTPDGGEQKHSASRLSTALLARTRLFLSSLCSVKTLPVVQVAPGRAVKSGRGTALHRRRLHASPARLFASAKRQQNNPVTTVNNTTTALYTALRPATITAFDRWRPATVALFCLPYLCS
jgi:hypothetical protein